MNDQDDASCLACNGVGLPCNGGGLSHDPDICGYVNDDCPDQCSDEHEVDRETVLECPVTGTHWRYCERCGWEVVSRYASEPYYIRGELLCEPDAHGYDLCGGCEEWYDQDDMRWSDYAEMNYCAACYHEYGGDRGSEPGQSTNYCRTCGTHDLNLDLLTERYLCDHLAIERHLKGVPVTFADESVPVRFLRRLAA